MADLLALDWQEKLAPKLTQPTAGYLAELVKLYHGAAADKDTRAAALASLLGALADDDMSPLDARHDAFVAASQHRAVRGLRPFSKLEAVVAAFAHAVKAGAGDSAGLAYSLRKAGAAKAVGPAARRAIERMSAEDLEDMAEQAFEKVAGCFRLCG